MSTSTATRPAAQDLMTELRRFEEFSDLPAEVLHWLLEKSTYHVFQPGEDIAYPGMAADHMQIILEGAYRVSMPQGGELRDMGIFESPSITGLLPFSRMKENRAYARVVEPLRMLRLHRDCFVEMVNVSYELVQQLVGRMSDRVRNFTELRLQNEKLMSLGKLSAGLAHELNNPAAAIVRSVEALYRQVHKTPEGFKAVITMRITPEETDQVNAILFTKLNSTPQFENLSLLQQETRKDELTDWLEDHEVAKAEDIAETLASFDFTEDTLTEIAEILDSEAIGPVLAWIESTLNLEYLVTEIQEAANRISGLVGAVKTYSHMDQTNDCQPMDIHEGIKSTIMMLKHKIKQKQISIDKSLAPDLPPVPVYPGELNQVWTNLIDNAIDAMSAGGKLEIKTYLRHKSVYVEITDNGSGIPEDLLNRIFDPFFTTKPVGEGTGLGLEVTHRIVTQRHKGQIKVESQPGRTTFTVCLPVE